MMSGLILKNHKLEITALVSIPVVAVDSEEPERDLRLRSLDLFLSFERFLFLELFLRSLDRLLFRSLEWSLDRLLLEDRSLDRGLPLSRERPRFLDCERPLTL